MGRLDGKVGFVSGGANGMGATEVRLMAAEGAKVAFGDRAEDQGRKMEAEVKAQGGDVLYIPMDVTVEADWERAIEETVSKFGRLDILVNNAGISRSSFSDHDSTEGWDMLWSINATGVFLGTKYAVPRMEAVGGGSIVNISSTAGLRGSAGGHPGYNASKGAVRMFTKAMAARLGPSNIRVNSVHPGRMPPMSSSTRSEAELEAQAAGWAAKTPLRRSGRSEEVGTVVVWLASDESSYVTGAEIPVDGGNTSI